MAGPILDSGLACKAKALALRGLVCAIPKQEIRNEFFYPEFGEEVVSDIVKMVGVHARRWVSDDQTTADLCQAAAEALISDLGWNKESIDALLFVSQTPDYKLPATACVLHGRLELPKQCAAFDINLGCSGYPYGLWLAAKLLDGERTKRILLLVGDTISKTANRHDRSTALLFGDAGSATALEFDGSVKDSYFILGTDGKGANNLMIPEGGFRKFQDDDARLAGKDPSCLFMDGGEIFNFTLKNVPQLVEDLMLFSETSREEVDAFLFHQANAFMLNHLVKKSKIPKDKAPINIDKFGNTSSASISLLIADQLTGKDASARTLAMFGFGVGYSWSAALLEDVQFSVNRLIEI